MANVVTNPTADQTISLHNLLPASGNSSQSLGTSGAAWNAALGTVSVKSLENVLYVDQFTGTGNNDVGDKINAAYASLPATGGIIVVPAGAYSFSTPISCGVNNKPAILLGYGSSNGGIHLTYTPTTGTAITLDWGWCPGAGIRDMALSGSGGGNATIGVSLGPTNGATGAVLSNFAISPINGPGGDGFGTGILYSNAGNAWGTFFQQCWIGRCGTGVLLETNQELIKFISCLFWQNSVGVQSNGGAEVACDHCHFDDNTFIGFNQPSGGVSTFTACHFENAGGGTSLYLASTGACTVIGGFMIDDVTTGTQGEFVLVTQGFFGMYGTYLASNGRTITQAINFSGTSYGDLHPAIGNQTVAALYNTSYSGSVFTAPFGAGADAGGYGIGIKGVSLGTPTGFGSGTAGTAVTTTTKGTGSGPTTPQTVVGYLKMNVAGTIVWIPYFK